MDIVKRFQYVRTLDEDAVAKRVVLLGLVDGKEAILTLEKTYFGDVSRTGDLLQEGKDIASNDVYYWGTALAKQELETSPACRYSLIFPATATHIGKYERSPLRMVRETPEAYETVVKPYVASMKGDRLQWVRNILHRGAEAERVLFKNTDYVLLPDMKWDGRSLDTLYCCCIVYDDAIASIRDLTGDHVQYLERIQESILSELPRLYAADGLSRSDLRLYVHYQPSYYHFHIHVVNSSFVGLANSMLAGKAFLLADVIDNLRFLGKQGYRQKVLTYQLKETHALWNLGLKNYAQ